MPRFDQQLLFQAQSASDIARAGEITRHAGGTIGRGEWSLVRLEALYELAYLRLFCAWEMCLEAVFLRSLCGYASRVGQEVLIRGQYYPTLADARIAVMGVDGYMLWHNPIKVAALCHRHIVSRNLGCPALQENVIFSRIARLADLGAIRHRIVHDNNNARRKFNQATLAIAGRTYPASRPGKFLRSRDTSTAHNPRWIDVLMGELVGLASQIV